MLKFMKEKKMKWILLVLLSSLSTYALKKEVVLLDLVKEYSSQIEKTILIDDEMKNRLRQRVRVEFKEKLSSLEFEQVLYTLLSEFGMTMRGDDGDFITIIDERDMRYLPGKFYQKNIPDSSQYVFYAHKLKYPVASEISRNLRPFMSRYGRVIDIKYGNLIIINDKANVVKRMVELFEKIDTKETFERLKKNKLKRLKRQRKDSKQSESTFPKKERRES